MSHLIVAIDTDSASKSHELIRKLDGPADILKFGLEYLYGVGMPPACRSPFIDAKLKDIPNTVAKAMHNIVRRFNPSMVTVFADGGPDMMKAAVEAAGNAMVCAATVLTSLKETNGQLLDIDVLSSARVHSLRLTKKALDCGVKAVVCSGLEAHAIRQAFGKKFSIIVPGIRPLGSASQDQKRICTPTEAIQLGADWIVVGRPITEAADPAGMARSIKAEAEAAYDTDG